jgi:hypothetical protein
VLSSDIKEASFVAQTLSCQHVCNRGGFFCLQISSHSRIMRAKAKDRARSPSIYLRSGAAASGSNLLDTDFLARLSKCQIIMALTRGAPKMLAVLPGAEVRLA